MIKGAIFDLDGTLLDSMFIWDTIGEAYLRSLGKEPKENLKETFKTFTVAEAAAYYRAQYGVTLSVGEITDGINGLLKHYYTDIVPLKPGAAAFLEKLKAHGVTMCIATAAERPWAEAALSRLGVRKYFTEIFTCASVGHGKTEPYIYREAQKHLGTGKTETAVFEDAFFALQTAKADGFVTVAVYDRHEKNEVKAAADFYIEDYTDRDGIWDSINK